MYPKQLGDISFDTSKTRETIELILRGYRKMIIISIAILLKSTRLSIFSVYS